MRARETETNTYTHTHRETERERDTHKHKQQHKHEHTHTHTHVSCLLMPCNIGLFTYVLVYLFVCVHVWWFAFLLVEVLIYSLILISSVSCSFGPPFGHVYFLAESFVPSH